MRVPSSTCWPPVRPAFEGLVRFQAHLLDYPAHDHAVRGQQGPQPRRPGNPGAAGADRAAAARAQARGRAVRETAARRTRGSNETAGTAAVPPARRCIRRWIGGVRRLRRSLPGIAGRHSRAGRGVPAAPEHGHATSWTSAAAVASCSTLLKARGVAARGVDANPAMVDVCRCARPCRWSRAMRWRFSAEQPDGSLGGIDRHPGRGALSAGLSRPVSRDGLSQAAPGRADCPRNDQPGLLAGVFRNLSARPDARAAAAPGHAAIPGAGQPVSHPWTCSSSGRSRTATGWTGLRIGRAPTPRGRRSPRPSTRTPTSSTPAVFSADYAVVGRR